MMINFKTASIEELKIEYKRLAKLVGDMPFGTKKEFYHLPAILADDEKPLAVATGLMGGNTWLITLTNYRIIFLDKGMVYGLKQVFVDLASVVSVSGRTKMMTGSITLSTTGQNYTIENVMKGAVTPFTNMVNIARETLSQQPQMRQAAGTRAQYDVITQLEKLAALKERGILSDQEFSVQKEKILAM
ncbi:PH domain-containing protein [Sodalis sp. C49]|uniref:PH domain-containing protein n=1 Tax=unclassified Sodalis (in: enterobacteria) TaxID=2636512 RepID=UPI003965B5E1